MWMTLSMVCFSFILSPLCGTKCLNSSKSSGRAARATPSMASSTVLYHKFDTYTKIKYSVAATMIMFTIQNLKGGAHQLKFAERVPEYHSPGASRSHPQLSNWLPFSGHCHVRHAKFESFLYPDRSSVENKNAAAL